jgi:hypothetical protein
LEHREETCELLLLAPALATRRVYHCSRFPDEPSSNDSPSISLFISTFKNPTVTLLSKSPRRDFSQQQKTTMLLRLPRNLHYPITVTELLFATDDEVPHFAPLFSYTYKTKVTETDRFREEKEVERTFPSRFESPVEGTLVEWRIRVGEVINSG